LAGVIVDKKIWSAGKIVHHEIDGVSQPLNSRLTNFVNFSRATARVARAAVAGKKIQVSNEERERRIAICEACEFFRNGKCLKCRCYTRFKAILGTERCPIGKW
jgi:hypothetical protein